jgi:hypothetical protein
MPLTYLYGQDEMVANWVAQMIPQVRRRGFGPCKAIGVVDRDNELIAGLVYHHLYEDDETGERLMELSAAAVPGRRWFTPATIAVMHRYPFLECNCQMLVATTPATNLHVQRQLAVLGYDAVYLSRMYSRKLDGVLMRLTYEDWCANKVTQRYKHHIVVTKQRKAA